MKLNIPRIFEKSQALSSDAGKQLTDFINFMADFVEQTTRALRNQVTIADNMDTIVSEVTVADSTETVVYTNGKIPSGIHVIKVSDKNHAVSAFRWYINDQNQTIVWCKYYSVPTSQVNLKLVIYFN